MEELRSQCDMEVTGEQLRELLHETNELSRSITSDSSILSRIMSCSCVRSKFSVADLVDVIYIRDCLKRDTRFREIMNQHETTNINATAFRCRQRGKSYDVFIGEVLSDYNSYGYTDCREDIYNSQFFWGVICNRNRDKFYSHLDSTWRYIQSVNSLGLDSEYSDAIYDIAGTKYHLAVRPADHQKRSVNVMRSYLSLGYRKEQFKRSKVYKGSWDMDFSGYASVEPKKVDDYPHERTDVPVIDVKGDEPEKIHQLALKLRFTPYGAAGCCDSRGDTVVSGGDESWKEEARKEQERKSLYIKAKPIFA